MIENATLNRLTFAIADFVERFGEFPKRFRTDDRSLQVLIEGLTPEQYAHLAASIEIIEDSGAAFQVESTEDRFFNYSDGSWGKGAPTGLALSKDSYTKDAILNRLLGGTQE